MAEVENKLGRRVKAERIAHGYDTQAAFVQAVAEWNLLTLNRLADIETGKVTALKATEMKLFQEVLQIDPRLWLDAAPGGVTAREGGS